MPLSDALPEACCCCIFFQKINFYSEHSAVTSDHLLVTYWSLYYLKRPLSYSLILYIVLFPSPVFSIKSAFIILSINFLAPVLDL